MEWVETTGKYIEEARELALDQLGVDASEAEFETLEEPKSGLFGRTRGVARVRARVSPLTPRPKTERRRRTKKGSDDAGSSEARPAAKKAPAKKAPAKKAPAKKVAETATDHDEVSGVDATEAPAATRSTDNDRNDGGRAPRSGGRREDSGAPREQMDGDEQITVLEEFLVELASGFGLEVTASSTLEDGELRVNLAGDSLGLLVGPRLATLDAIQEIGRNALQRQAAGREYAKVVVDVADIRQRRSAALTEFVSTAAETVRNDDAVVVFEVMSSVDRKQVHDVAAELDGVRSASEGEDPRRRVVLRKD